MKKIFLSGSRGAGKTTLVDDDDYEKYKDIRWYLSDMGYAVIRKRIGGKKKTLRLHRLITNCPDGLVVDHINRDKLDNRKSNLRCVTQAVNMQNRDAVENARGYYYSKSKCRGNNHWVVEYMGISNIFHTEKEAASAVERIKNGSFVKRKEIVHKICLKCGSNKQWYGSQWVCRRCSLERMKIYYQRKKERKWHDRKEELPLAT